MLLNAVRYDLAALLLFGYLGVRVDEWRPTTRSDVFAVVGGGLLWIGLGNGVWFVGQKLTSSVFSGTMPSLIPVMTVAFSWVLLPEDRLTPLSLVGLGVSIAGAVVITVPADGLTIDGRLVGTGLLFVGVCGAALGSVLIRRARPSIPNATTTAWSVTIGAVFLHVLSPLVGESVPGDVTVASWLGLAYLCVFSTVFAYLLYFSLLERHSAIELSLVTYLIPVVAGTAGWLVFGEPITESLVVGFPIVLSGFLLMKRDAIRTEVERVRSGV
ncbi:DMT family transporter [Haloarculaceae archaeon H-GB11]|nr:DMT family transporter [Haloarculaceae archaeon H-GB11]